MNSNLLFNFIVNKENRTVNVEREFAANLDLVWDAWTKPEILDQWWAPKPYQNKTNQWILARVGLGFMQWSAQKTKCIGVKTII